MENGISQEELNNLNLTLKTDLDNDIKNIVILIRNELNVLENSISYYNEKRKKGVKRKLNKILNEVIDIRKA